MYSSLWKDPVIGGRMVKTQTRGTRPTILKPGFSSGLDQCSREIMHVRQSNCSTVSSFDVITGHLVRCLITIYTTHGEVSHLISCYCWDEHRQWSHLSVWKTTSLDVLLNMQVMTSYNEHVCSWIVDLWRCTFLNGFVTLSPGSELSILFPCMKATVLQKERYVNIRMRIVCCTFGKCNWSYL